MRSPGRARQPQAKSLGVLPWQRDFWLLLVEHALAKQMGPPELRGLEGFSTPAVTQYTVTTPDLLHSFRKYNADKPYHRQVRPFGFMVMFQQDDDADASTVMRVIAPFNRNPAKAAKKAFDRDTGAAVPIRKLKTYVEALRTYYNHPEAKFLNGERGDRGPTHRRYVIARSIVHIGKEANKLDIQSASGIDPEAQVEFNVDIAKTVRLKAISAAVVRYGAFKIAREAGLSRKHISSVAGGGASATQRTLSNIERAISSLDIIQARRLVVAAQALNWLQAECNRIGLRQVARGLGLSPSTLSRVITGQRQMPIKLMRMVDHTVSVSG